MSRILGLGQHFIDEINVMGDHSYRRLVYAAVLDQVLHLVVLPGPDGFSDDQDIVVADVLVGNATLRIPVLHHRPVA